ncbi:MAG: hypothetical protein KDA52_19940 [Planctomycetaceae bacterium]|nr:hypothetical protein [Planctomycetaceae bacterium]
MQVEQALFTSAQTRHARGYHLVARSSGITDNMAKALAVWSPSHDSLVESHAAAESLNYYRLNDEWAALTRSVNGESEYSNRGGLRLETNMLVFRASQLAGYDHHPLLLADTALSLGHLRLRDRTPQQLGTIELPQSSWGRIDEPGLNDESSHEFAVRVIKQLTRSRVMIIGAARPKMMVQAVLDRLPPRVRGRVTFSTGLRPSLHRPFSLQFLPQLDDRLREKMASADVVCLDVPATVALSH